MAMMSTSILLLSMLRMVSCTNEDHACVGPDGRTASCESVLSWAMSADDEDVMQGLEMLQIKKTPLEAKGCPVPDMDKFVEKGKGCAEGEAPPGEDDVCLNGRKSFMYLEEAWKACGKNDECSFVMEAPDGQYFLRRAFDPDTTSVGAKLYTYNCGAHMQEQTEAKADSKQKLKEDGQKANAKEHHEPEEEAVVLDDSDKLIETMHPQEDTDDAHHEASNLKEHATKQVTDAAKKASKLKADAANKALAHKAEADETQTEEAEEESGESEEDGEEESEESDEESEEAEESEDSAESEEGEADEEEEDGEVEHDDHQKSKETEEAEEDAEEE